MRAVGPVTFARRLKDPLPQPPYDRLLGPPIDAVPIEAFALRSVHCRQRTAAYAMEKPYPVIVSNLPFGSCSL